MHGVSLDRTLHGVEVMTSILASGESGKFITHQNNLHAAKSTGTGQKRGRSFGERGDEIQSLRAERFAASRSVLGAVAQFW